MKKREFPGYSISGKLSKYRFTGWFLNHFYKIYTLEKDIADSKYIISYHRSPFWGYEDPSLKLFFRDKLCTWHGQVWEILPHGSRVGYGTTCIKAMFPRKQMKKFLNRESKFVWEACNPGSKLTK